MAEIKIDINDLYRDNADFKSYVDKYAKLHSEGKPITVEEALEHSIVQEYAIWIVGRERRCIF